MALVDLDGAVFAGESRLARADKVVDRVVASATILAWIAATVVDVLFAVSADETGSAVAFVVCDKVDTRAAVLARIDGAVVDVVIAVFAGESDRASALKVSSVGDDRASGAVGALVVLARVHLGLASPTGEGRLAVALEIVVDVGARAPVFAG